ncbi:hypothetical protein PPHE_a0678 [Pseudoalteromonas phenolica O-BC30]|nr:hypothetical protein [Pseudoalteromonas phenolica O-BC30]
MKGYLAKFFYWLCCIKKAANAAFLILKTYKVKVVTFFSQETP